MRLFQSPRALQLMSDPQLVALALLGSPSLGRRLLLQWRREGLLNQPVLFDPRYRDTLREQETTESPSRACGI